LKLKTFVHQRRQPGKKKDNPQNGRKCFHILSLMGVHYPEYIKNSYSTTIKRQPNLKMGKEFNRHFSKDKQAQKMFSIVTEMQIRTTVRYHFTFGRMVIIF